MPLSALPLAGVRPAAGLLKALADDNRLRIVALLAAGELCVCHIAAALELTQPNASQHLTVLRNAGLVEGERRGSWIHYRLVWNAAPGQERILRAVLEAVAPAAGDGDRLHAAQGQVSCG